MFHPDTSLDLPTGCDLLAELGVDRRTVREITEDERAIRCPDRGAACPVHGFASLFPEPALGMSLQEAAPAEFRDPAAPLPPANRRWRRA